MDAQSRKALSWSLSILVHLTLLFFVIRAGIHYAIPEGEVIMGQSIDMVEATKSVQVDVVSKTVAEEPTTNAEETQDKSAPELPATHEVKAPKYKITPEKEDADTEPPPKFMPDKEPQDVVPAPKNDDADADNDSNSDVDKTEDQTAPPAPVETKKVETQKEIPKELPQKQEAEQPAQDNPNPEEMKSVQEVAQQNPPAEQAEQAANPTASQPNGNSQGNPNSPPPFGAPGTLLDETKLTELPGNEKPSYPWMAKLRRQEGTVVLRAFIKQDGTVDLPILAKSSGYSLLDQECLRAYSHWRYQPGPSGWVLKPFRFILKGN